MQIDFGETGVLINGKQDKGPQGVEEDERHRRGRLPAGAEGPAEGDGAHDGEKGR